MLHHPAVRERLARTKHAFVLFPWRRWFSGFVFFHGGMRLVGRGRARACEKRPAALPSNCRAREEPSTGRRRLLTLEGAQPPVAAE